MDAERCFGRAGIARQIQMRACCAGARALSGRSPLRPGSVRRLIAFCPARFATGRNGMRAPSGARIIRFKSVDGRVGDPAVDAAIRLQCLIGDLVRPSPLWPFGNDRVRFGSEKSVDRPLVIGRVQ